MTRCIGRLSALSLLLLAVAGSRPLEAQYFGRNKVQYERFDWRIISSDHFDLYFYPAESLRVHDAGREEERWYTRLSEIFRHQFDRKSIVFYADHPDFQQTNVIGEQPSEGTGGVTEGMRTRVVLPFTGVYNDDEHVIGHELVHVFQYNIAETAPGQGGLNRLNALPLWLIEGMAEYFSLGRNDPLTAMWMRDAVLRDTFPTIKQLTTDPRFFPYRYGQALWAYIGGRWGDRAVVDVYRTSLRLGWDQALVRALGLSSDSLSKDWASANKAFYAGQFAGRTHPDSIGKRIVTEKERSEYNVGPSLSPDGRFVAFFTSKTNLFGVELVLADATNGRIIRTLASPERDGHFDAISFLNSSGDFSPDGERFAFIVYAKGNNEIAIIRTRDGAEIKRVRPANLGAIYSVAWAPDGNHVVLAGSRGGVSDLYLMDVNTNDVRQLTNDRYAQMQPVFSPDGRTIAFATDLSTTDFTKMTFGSLQLATMDVETGQVTVRPAFPVGKHINPQFSPDGANLFFVSDQDGVSDVYRLDLRSNEIFRLTKMMTGVSGVTQLSPAISVASKSGTLMFTTFKGQGHEIVQLPAPMLVGTRVDAALATRTASAATLPPGDVAGNMTVATYLSDPNTGLPSGNDFKVAPYHAQFALDALGQPSVGVATGPFGTGFAGGISALWGDQLGDQQIFSAVQANGTIRDFGGAVYYQNLKRRLNWLAGISHVPYLTGGQYADAGSSRCPGNCIYQIIQRIYIDQAVLDGQYPLSATRRFEVGASGTRLGSDIQIDSVITDPSFTRAFGSGSTTQGGPAAVYYWQGKVAFVGDNSNGAFVGPVSGHRYRLQLSPTLGSVQFNEGLIDARRYFFARPFTFAVRGMHFGRYGRDADNYQRLSPLYLGEETMIRGYGYGSFTTDECNATASSGPTQTFRCPVFERLLGSRLAVVNAEFRIPVFGTSYFGLVNFPYLPLEVSPFFDAGLAWTSTENPDLRFATNDNTVPTNCSGVSSTFAYVPCATRIPVFSAGVSFRMNVLGYMILETYVAHPFQRPGKNWVVGIQMAPGW